MLARIETRSISPRLVARIRLVLQEADVDVAEHGAFLYCYPSLTYDSISRRNKNPNLGREDNIVAAH